MFPALDAGVASAAKPAPAEIIDQAMAIEQLRMCPIPPLRDNLLLDHANAGQKIRNWFYNGAKPQSRWEVADVAEFCIRHKLPDALSWLVLQCEVDRLDLMGRGFRAHDAQMIASWLERCPRPIALDITKNDIGEEGAIALATALKANSTLTSLNVADNNIGATGTKALAAVLKDNSTLTSLNVSLNSLGDIGATAFADAIRTNATLTSLVLANNKIGVAGAEALADALKTNSTLTSLSVSHNKIGASGATVFAAALKFNSTLTSLNVAHNEIDTAGATAFADVLMSNSTLTSLFFRDNSIGATGAIALADALKTNSTLTWLDVTANDLGNTGATTLDLLTDAARATSFAGHQDEIDRRLTMNEEAKPFIVPAAEAFLTLPVASEWKLPLEVGALIVKDMITLGPDEGDGLEGLQSLVIANDIAKQRNRDEKR